MEALENFKDMRIVPFDVPGHKRGRGSPELTKFLGQQCMTVDVNSMKPLDNLCHPTSVIREAEELAADAFGAAHAFLMVGGTTSSVQAMILSVVKRGDEIILPRNVHRSVINALVLTGDLTLGKAAQIGRKAARRVVVVGQHEHRTPCVRAERRREVRLVDGGQPDRQHRRFSLVDRFL